MIDFKQKHGNSSNRIMGKYTISQKTKTVAKELMSVLESAPQINPKTGLMSEPTMKSNFFVD